MSETTYDVYATRPDERVASCRAAGIPPVATDLTRHDAAKLAAVIVLCGDYNRVEVWEHGDGGERPAGELFPGS